MKTELNNRREIVAGVAGQNFFDLGDNFFGRVVAFDNIFHGPTLESFFDVVFAGHVGKHDDRNAFGVRGFLKGVENFQTVHFGHHDIEQNQIGFKAFKFLQTLLAVVGHLDFEFFKRKSFLVHAPNQSVVFHNEQASHAIILDQR